MEFIFGVLWYRFINKEGYLFFCYESKPFYHPGISFCFEKSPVLAGEYPVTWPVKTNRMWAKIFAEL